MLGPRQQQIIAALANGPCSLAALEHQAGVERGATARCFEAAGERGSDPDGRQTREAAGRSDGAVVEGGAGIGGRVIVEAEGRYAGAVRLHHRSSQTAL